MTLFRDRKEAGQKLAQQLADRPLGENPVAVGLARGGVPVAHEVARRLEIPLDVLVVRKLGVPYQPELAFGAIASGDIRLLNDDIVRIAGIGDAVIEDVTARQRRELHRREQLYRGDRESIDFDGRTVVIVDDGVATGATMTAAIRSARKRHPNTLIAAVPVASRNARRKIEGLVDELVCLATPDPFGGVGAWYDDFRETTDDDVRALLDDAPR